MEILLTNDDSHRSPLLQFILEKAAGLGNVTAVVPKHEQSWTGKSISRFSKLVVEEISLFGTPAFTLTGTPADCINVGIYHLARKRPDLVISGINAGLNTGTCFIFSSGTVGACFEANIAGIPAVAISQEFDSAARNDYAAEYALPAQLVERLARQTRELLGMVFTHLTSQPSFLNSPVTWNVNLPFLAVPGCKLKSCRLARHRYGSFFRATESGYEHGLLDINREESPDADGTIVASGHVAVSRLDINSFGQSA